MTLLDQLQSVPWERGIACGVGAYLIGCFATGYYLVQLRTGRDIREIESGATGARNVGRVLGPAGFFLTVFGDFSKGVLAVWLAIWFSNNAGVGTLALLAVVVGHIWPFQLRFRGGKGVATSLGAMLVFDWRLAAVYVLVFAGLFAFTRRTVLPGLFAYLCLPFLTQGLTHDPLKSATMLCLSIVVLFAHRRNLVEEIPALAARCQVKANPEKPKL